MLFAALLATPAFAQDTYEVDTVHSAVLFKAHHFDAGYTWGRFNAFEGGFVVEGQQPRSMQVTVTCDSVDTNATKRDNHLKSPDFLECAQYPEITFASSAVAPGEKGFEVTGKLTLHGVTKEITVPVTFTGEGKDPWGGYRMGYETSFMVHLPDYGIHYDGVGDDLLMTVALEGTKKRK